MGITPKVPILSEVPEFPEAIGYVYDWFREVSLGLQGNGFSYPSLTWEGLDCWARLTRQDLEPREARTIMALGNIRAGIMSEKKPDAGKS